MTYLLKITSWAERFRGRQCAEHYYGSIREDGSKEKIELTHVVEIRNPAYADSSLRYHLAKPGETMETIRFETRDQVREAAQKWMKENAKPNDTLVEV